MGLPRIHLEVSKGSPRQASDYCKKQPVGRIVEIGEVTSSGRRYVIVVLGLSYSKVDHLLLLTLIPGSVTPIRS